MNGLAAVDENRLRVDKSNIYVYIITHTYIVLIYGCGLYICNSRATCKWIVRSGSCVYSRVNDMMLQRSWQDTLAMFIMMITRHKAMRSAPQNQCLVILDLFCFNIHFLKEFIF